MSLRFILFNSFISLSSSSNPFSSLFLSLSAFVTCAFLSVRESPSIPPPTPRSKSSFNAMFFAASFRSILPLLTASLAESRAFTPLLRIRSAPRLAANFLTPVLVPDFNSVLARADSIPVAPPITALAPSPAMFASL